MKSAMLKFTGSNLLSQMASSGNGLNASYAPQTGIVMYWTDGFESKTAESITAQDFENTKYTKNQLLGKETVVTGRM